MSKNWKSGNEIPFQEKKGVGSWWQKCLYTYICNQTAEFLLDTHAHTHRCTDARTHTHVHPQFYCGTLKIVGNISFQIGSSMWYSHSKVSTNKWTVFFDLPLPQRPQSYSAPNSNQSLYSRWYGIVKTIYSHEHCHVHRDSLWTPGTSLTMDVYWV